MNGHVIVILMYSELRENGNTSATLVTLRLSGENLSRRILLAFLTDAAKRTRDKRRVIPEGRQSTGPARSSFK